MQNIYRRMIDISDFAEEIIIVNNGEEALDYYRNLLNLPENDNRHRFPDVIFLDLNMPVMNGWKFLEEFQALYLHKELKPSIVVISSSVDSEDRKRANKYSVAAFLSKPLTFEILNELKSRLNHR